MGFVSNYGGREVGGVWCETGTGVSRISMGIWTNKSSFARSSSARFIDQGVATKQRKSNELM